MSGIEEGDRRTDEIRQTILPWGNSNDPTSPHFADQMPLFAARKLKPALLTRPEIEAAATRRVVLD